MFLGSFTRLYVTVGENFPWIAHNQNTYSIYLNFFKSWNNHFLKESVFPLSPGLFQISDYKICLHLHCGCRKQFLAGAEIDQPSYWYTICKSWCLLVTYWGWWVFISVRHTPMYPITRIRSTILCIARFTIFWIFWIFSFCLLLKFSR